MHQTVIGIEALEQFAMAANTPIWSSAVREAAPISRASLSPSCTRISRTDEVPPVIAAEPASCPSLTRGKYTFDYR